MVVGEQVALTVLQWEYMNERDVWRDVEGFEGFYQVSNGGKVRRVKRERCEHCGNPGNEEKILRGFGSGQAAYDAVAMSKPGMGSSKGKTVTRTVHRMVAIAFVPGRTAERNVVNHKDCNKRNNTPENLEWVTAGENNKHAYRMGRKVRRHAKMRGGLLAASPRP